jgi:hypothetical protein
MSAGPLVFTGNANRSGKRDFTGAFDPEARTFAKLHGGSVIRVPLEGSEIARRKCVLGHIGIHQPSWVAFVCHGLTTGIELGFRRIHVGELAEALAAARCPRVTLYACSTSGGPGLGGDGGFADMLRDAMCRAGLTYCLVDGHVGPGHATQRPHVRRFEGNGSLVGGTGGSWIVAPGSGLWKPWVRALRDTDLRFRFPRMTVGAIHAELLGRGEC